MRLACLLVVALLAGCAPAQPLVDMRGADPVAYQRVLDRCAAIASPDNPNGPLLVGVIIGGTMGLGLATMITGYVEETGAAIGAASGAVAGGAIAATTNLGETLSPGPRQSLDECLASHGYRVVGHI